MGQVWRRPDEEIIVQWVEACEDNSERLNEWETSFIESMRGRLDNHWRLTDNQVQTLEKIYADRTP